MSRDDIIRAWQDEEFRDSLSEDQQAALPDNPAGLVALNEDELNAINTAAAATSWPCVGGTIAITEFASCAPTCEETFFGGSCPFGTTGCCAVK